MQVLFGGRSYRFPAEALGGTAESPRLRPAAELLLRWLAERDGPVGVIHDSFGVLSTLLHERPGTIYLSDNYSHHRRRLAALAANGLPASDSGLPRLDEPAQLQYAVVQVPKSLELFEAYLANLAANAPALKAVAASFMTRHFTPRLLEIAARYGEVSQSRAYKKARTLVISHWKGAGQGPTPPRQFSYRGRAYAQYPGVFSTGKIDFATRFLLETWDGHPSLGPDPSVRRILDIGVGTGVIGLDLRAQHYPDAQLFGTDVSHAAIRSARANAPLADYRWQDDLRGFEPGAFDLIVTNPPFHDGHRNSIGPTLELFKQAKPLLTKYGRLVVVANRHLNYATHLRRSFNTVIAAASTRKYVILIASA